MSFLPQSLRTKSKLVNLFTGNFVFCGQVLCCYSHRSLAVRVSQANPQRVLELYWCTEHCPKPYVSYNKGRLTHVFRTSSQNHIWISCYNVLRSTYYSLKARTTQPIDAESRTIDGYARTQCGMSRHERTIWGWKRKNIADNYRINLLRLQSCSCYSSFVCHLLQICYTFLYKLPAISTIRCALCGHNKDSFS